MDKYKLIEKVKRLVELYKSGKLGGETLPEDSNPNLGRLSEENILYLTLPMALNYQRNSYKLWESALKTWQDCETNSVFYPEKVINMDMETLKDYLIKYKVALQPNKQPLIWKKLCETIYNKLNGSIISFFKSCDFDIRKIKNFILNNKKDFPYLSGTKILNYWLYVLTCYTDFKFTGKEFITIAPDTHIIQSSVRLGVVKEDELTKSNIREIVSDRWNEILKDTDLLPIDLHTTFWLWSRGGFKVE